MIASRRTPADCSRRIGDLAHPDAPQPAPADLLNCHGNQHLIQLRRPHAPASAAPQWVSSTSTSARQPVPAMAGPSRGVELVQPRPRRLVASQTQGSLQPQGAHPTLLVGDPPHRPKPRRQRRPRVLEDRPRRHRGLVGAVRALPPPPGRARPSPITTRAPKSLRPPELLQIRLTRLLRSRIGARIRPDPGILLHRPVRYILGLPESSKYLVAQVLDGRRQKLVPIVLGILRFVEVDPQKVVVDCTEKVCGPAFCPDPRMIYVEG